MYSARVLLIIKIVTKKFKETEVCRYIYQNELDKACFQNDIAHKVYKYLARWTASGKVLRDRAFQIASNLQYDVDW